MPGSHPFLELLSELGPPAACTWLGERYAGLGPDTFAVAYAGAGRRFGDSPARPSKVHAERLRTAGLPVPEGWPLKHIARSVLLQRLLEVSLESEHGPALTQLFRGGDNAEREALLKTLPLLPEAGRFVDIGVEACRSHVQSVFEAIACENPYPARYFADPSFNQLVLKAFFTGVAVKRIAGLAERRNAELIRMANAYASERRAAGRSVPADLDRVTRGTGLTPEEER